MELPINPLVYLALNTFIALIFALLEIQIEGKNGWAKDLPTWKFYKPWFKYIPGGNKPITGYHFYTWVLIFLYLHTVYVFVPFSLKTELVIVSSYIYITRLEDFLWFVLNPNYGIKKFKKGQIPWHKDWIGPLPSQYYVSALFWFACLYLVSII